MLPPEISEHFHRVIEIGGRGREFKRRGFGGWSVVGIVKYWDRCIATSRISRVFSVSAAVLCQWALFR
jgi:hypothetical protein